MEPGNFQAQTTTTLPTKEDQQNQLVLLGLQLLSKSLKLPYAVVKPRQQPPKQSRHDEELSSGLVNSRKRKHSEEPTMEERREKRKLMNRVAAQNARDRKRLYLESLEKKVADLETQNELLMAENSQLRAQSNILETEMKQLEIKLARSNETMSISMASKREEELGCTVRSAAETHLSDSTHLPVMADSQYGLLDDQLTELAVGETRLRDSLPVHSFSEPQPNVDQSLPGDDGADPLVGSPPVYLEPSHELNQPTPLPVGLFQDSQPEDIELNFSRKIPFPEGIPSDYASFLLPNASIPSQANPLLSGSELDIFQPLDVTCEMPQLSWDLEHLLANC